MTPQYYKLESISNLPKEDGYYIFLYEDRSGCTCSYDVKSGEGSDGSEIFKMAEEFKFWLSSVPAIGARWVKASEKIPNNWGSVISRTIKDKQVITDVWSWNTGFVELLACSSRVGECIYFDEIEWLDESTTDSIAELEKEVERLKKGTKNADVLACAGAEQFMRECGIWENVSAEQKEKFFNKLGTYMMQRINNL